MGDLDIDRISYNIVGTAKARPNISNNDILLQGIAGFALRYFPEQTTKGPVRFSNGRYENIILNESSLDNQFIYKETKI